jgi:hypothetical protein
LACAGELESDGSYVDSIDNTRRLKEHTTMADQQIDRDKLRVAIRRMSDTNVLYLLDEAIDLLPQSKLIKLVEHFWDPATLRPDDTAEGTLLNDVKAFEKASLSGEYYEAFRVDSKNYMEKSGGTQAWIAECNRLLDRCASHAGKGNPGEVCQAIETIVALLDRIDECLDDIIFFADEGGSWQVGADWEKVLPAWFTCLSATTDPQEYARRVVETIEKYVGYDRDKYLATARRIASPAQRKSLREMP